MTRGVGCRTLRITVLGAALMGVSAGPAAAQADERVIDALENRLVIGKPVTITGSNGQVVKGRLTDVSDSSLALMVDGRLRSFGLDQLTQVRQRQADSLKNGILFGAASGAAYALMWFVRDPNECGGTPCVSEFVVSSGIGALIGLGIDALIRRTVTIDMDRAPRHRLAPSLEVGRGRALAGFALRF